MNNIYTALLRKETSLAVVGLGYVGLPIALAFAKHIKVIGFDISEERIELMKKGIDPSNELQTEHFLDKDITFTSHIEDLKTASFYVVAVPTPVDRHKVPNLKALLSASTAIGQVLKKGDYVVYESTVYPSCTENDCLPVLEKISGLKCYEDFKLGYSPERINPGDTEHTLSKVVKVVSGCDAESLENIAKIYELVVEAGIHRASSIKVAEAAKVIENTQRDVNIALMNELAIIFDKMDINTQDVLEAARTKWNFLPFYPGLVGGHCIGVDPYYLTYKSIELGHQPEVILSGRRINDGMGEYIATRLLRFLIKAGKNISQARVLVMGITFKENVSDIRNSKVVDVIKELQDFGIKTDIIDPYAEKEVLEEEYQLHLNEKASEKYDAVVVAVKHKEYDHLTEDYFLNLTNENGILIDIKGIYNKKIKKMTYWTL